MLNPLAVLQLQRMVGNAAVVPMLNQPKQPTVPVQRKIPVSKYDGTHADKVEKYAISLDESVLKAWGAIQAAPLLGTLHDLDGHTAHWVETILDSAAGTKASLPHAAFGYAVESLATGPLRPKKPDGLSVHLQGARKGTRPDLILRDSTGDVAWLDITASNNEGHVEKKAGWDKMESYAEVTYPSVEPADFAEMEATVRETLKAGKSPELNLEVDPVEVKAKIEAARKELAEKKVVWRGRIETLLADARAISVGGVNAHNGDQRRRDKTVEILSEQLKPEVVDEFIAASILHALKLNTGTYGFHTVSCSAATGLSILQQWDPA